MASSYNTSSLFVSFMLLFLFIGLSVQETNDVLNNICSQTIDPAFCLQTLKADPRTVTQNLHDLEKNSIDTAHANAIDTASVIITIIGVTNDPKMLKGYKLCSNDYISAVDVLESANQALSSRNYGGIITQASSASDKAADCESGLQIPPTEPSPLRDRNQNLKRLCSIIIAIAKSLPGSN